MKMTSVVTFWEMNIPACWGHFLKCKSVYNVETPDDAFDSQDVSGGMGIFCWSDNETEKNCNEVGFDVDTNQTCVVYSPSAHSCKLKVGKLNFVSET